MSNFFGFRGNNNIDGGNDIKKSLFSKLDNAAGMLNNMMGEMKSSTNCDSLIDGAKRFDMSSVRQLVAMYESDQNGSKTLQERSSGQDMVRNIKMRNAVTKQEMLILTGSELIRTLRMHGNFSNSHTELEDIPMPGRLWMP